MLKDTLNLLVDRCCVPHPFQDEECASHAHGGDNSAGADEDRAKAFAVMFKAKVPQRAQVKGVVEGVCPCTIDNHTTVGKRIGRYLPLGVQPLSNCLNQRSGGVVPA